MLAVPGRKGDQMTTELRADALRSALSCEVIVPADTGFDEARTIFNATIDRRPAAIVWPRSTEDVASAVRWARAEGLPIAVRGGGHNVAGHAVADGSLVIDLRLRRDVVVDPARRLATVGGGALWVDVDAATTAHGLAVTGGTFGDTGVGGLTLGGGLGFLMGTGGLTCDNLVRAEVVTADGSVVTAGEGGDPELLWALRGGGGNFGVVTEFEFGLKPVGPLYAGYLSVPIEAAGLAMRVLAEFARDMPDELAIFAGGPGALDEEAAAEGRPTPAVFSITVVFQGTPDEAEAAIRPLRSLPVVADTVMTKTYLEVQAMSGELPFGLRHYWKGHFTRELDGTTIDATVDAMDRKPGSGSFVLIEAMSGAARHEPPGGAAFGQREARWNVSAIAIWEDPADDARQIAWAREYADALKPASLSGAGYANYSPVDETPERIRASYGSARFARLAAVKRRYDPDNAFRFNLNIPPG
jgi:FAD/FMN-containing dehydrogenase